MIFWFTGLAIAAVGKTAGEVVREVRRQFKENPGIMEYKQKPDYRACVSLVTEVRGVKNPACTRLLPAPLYPAMAARDSLLDLPSTGLYPVNVGRSLAGLFA